MDKLNLKFKSGNNVLDISENSLYNLINVEGLEKTKKDYNLISNANYDGSVITGQKIVSKYISIKADYKGFNKEIERKKLISFFNTKEKGELIIGFGEDKKLIEYEIEDFSCPIVNIYEDLVFTVDLVCSEPFFKNISESKVNIALWRGAFRFPLTIPPGGIIKGYREPNLIVNINNIGDVETGMLIEFKASGTVVNPSFFNVNTREFIKLNRTMQGGEVIKINTNLGKKKITTDLNGIETNILNYLDLESTFLQLDVGDNIYRYDAEENLNNLEVNVYFNPKYLGV